MLSANLDSMAQTTTVRPMARKKQVPEKYCPNSYRVISEQAETIINDRPEKSASSSIVPQSVPTASNILGQPPAETRPLDEHRHNRPNPGHVGFLRQDVKLLNEPVCDVYTTSTIDEQHKWWPSRTSKDPLQVPPYTLDTTIRSDFQYKGKHVDKSTRHGSNPNTTPALGVVPVNQLREKDGKQSFWKEGFSYEHQYNCRLDPSYPTRGKRHGSFVWDRLQPYQVNKMLQKYGYISNKIQDKDNPFDAATATESSSSSRKSTSKPESASAPQANSRHSLSVSQPTAAHQVQSGDSGAQTCNMPPVAV